MHYLTPLVDFTGAVEDVVSALRSKAFLFFPPIGEAILLGMDRVKWVGPDWLAQHSADSFLPDAVLQAFRQLATAENTVQRDDRTTKLLRHLGVKSPAIENQILIQPAADILCIHASPKQQADLRFSDNSVCNWRNGLSIGKGERDGSQGLRRRPMKRQGSR